MYSLFIFELDGITAETPEQAREWQEQYEQWKEETYAENAWLRAAEYDPTLVAGVDY